MKKLGLVAALGLALAVPLSSAHALGERLWQVCGGQAYAGYSGFALCASVQVSVTTGAGGTHVVTMKIYNMAGTNTSYTGTVFTSLGLDNIVPALDVVNGTLSVTGPCLENASGCDYSQYWSLYNDKSIGGGIKVDVLAGSYDSQYSIASSCGVADGTTPGHQLYFVTDCVPGGSDFVTLSFQVTSDFDPNNASLFVKGQNGYNEGSTQCITGGRNENCGPTTVVPEPITMALFGSGLAAMGGAGFFKRRRKEEDATEV
jgi:hypothetical protein